MIKGKLGGNNRPKEPATVMRPKEKTLLYPSFINIGKKRPPSAKIVTPDPPVSAVKKPQSKTKIIGVPPGIQPKAERNKLTKRVEALLSASI